MNTYLTQGVVRVPSGWVFGLDDAAAKGRIGLEPIGDGLYRALTEQAFIAGVVLSFEGDPPMTASRSAFKAVESVIAQPAQDEVDGPLVPHGEVGVEEPTKNAPLTEQPDKPVGRRGRLRRN